MQAIILLGGKGKRLFRLYPDRPKALVPVAGKPFLERQLAWLGHGGITDIHLAAGHQSERLVAWLAARASTETSNPAKRGASTCPARGGIKRPTSNGQVRPEFRKRHPTDKQCKPDLLLDVGCWMLDVGRSGSALSITFSAEPASLGTAGGLKYVEPFIRSDPFLVLNGDSLMPHLDFTALKQAHRRSHAIISLAVTRVRETGRYGTIEFDAEHRISAFHEKTERKEGWVNGGVYLMSRQVLAGMEPDAPCSLEVDLFPRLARQGQLRAFPVTPPLLDMGTPEGLSAMERYFRNKAKDINHRGHRDHREKRHETL